MLYNETMSNGSPKVPHYYGDIVRRIFLSVAVIMLATLPFFTERLPVSVPISLLIIILMGIFAGVTNPVKLFPAFIDFAVSLGAVVVFEYYAVRFYQEYSSTDMLFWLNQGFAFLFLFALYFSTKTLRGMLLDKHPR